MRRRTPSTIASFILVLLVLGACQPASPAPRAPAGADSEPVAAAPSAPRAPKTIVIGGGRQHTDMGAFGVSDYEIRNLVDGELVRKNAQTFTAEPWLAEERPSIDKGTWVVHPDGTMTTRWTMRPNIKWHDGTPFSTQDFILGWDVIRDTRIPFGDRSVAQNISRIETPDDRTLILHWSKSFNRADQLYGTKLRAFPRHILEDVYRSGNLEAFSNHPWWTSGFISTGPFKVTRWEQNVELDMTAFDDYFLGRPKVDRVIWRFIPDINAMLSNVLSDNVDAALRQAFTLDTGLVAKQQWADQGKGTVHFTPVNMDRVGLTPTNPWLRDIRVRQAFIHAINRQEIVETISHGLESVAHIPLSPNRPQFPQAVAAATKYDYDPARAQALLAEAGWTRGPDGILVNAQGERFVIDGRSGTQEFEVQLQSATIDNWRRVGVSVDVHNLTAREEASEEYRGRYSGAKWGWGSFSVEQWRFFYGTENIPTAENRWIGSNDSRWDDPRKQAILDEMDQTLDPARFDQALVDFARVFSEQLPLLPLKLQAEVMSVRKGVQNIFPRPELGGENTRTWNAEQWDIQS